MKYKGFFKGMETINNQPKSRKNFLLLQNILLCLESQRYIRKEKIETFFDRTKYKSEKMQALKQKFKILKILKILKPKYLVIEKRQVYRIHKINPL